MSKDKKAIAGNYMLPVIEYIDQHRLLDSTALLDEYGIKRHKLNSSFYYLTTTQYIGLMTKTLEHTKAHALIQYILSKHHIAQHGLLGLLSLCSVNLRQAIKMLLHFYKLRSRLITIEFIKTDNQAILRLEPAIDLAGATQFTVEMALASLFQCKQEILNITNPQDEIHIAYSNRHEAVLFPERTTYETSHNELVFPIDELALKLKNTDQTTVELLEKQCEDLLAEHEENNFTDHVRQKLREANIYPTLDGMANLLAVSTRTLSRKLKADNTSYQTLLDGERIARAKIILLKTDTPITEIAAQLDFTDSSHFNRLFKHYTNETPSHFRKAHRPI